MRKKNIIFSLLTLLLVSFVVVGRSSKQTSEKTTVGTPTLFFHGFGSSKNVLAVIKKPQANYKFKKINLVGHSFGI